MIIDQAYFSDFIFDSTPATLWRLALWFLTVVLYTVKQASTSERITFCNNY